MRWRRVGLLGSGLWALVILVVVIRSIAAPHQNSVFLVFRDAGRQWLAAAPLYAQVGKYLYSPLAAGFFSPLALVPDWAGSALWRLATSILYLLGFVTWLRRFTSVSEDRAVVPLGMLLLLPLSIGNLNNGQTSPLIIALLFFACIATLDEHWTFAAIWITAASFFKVYPLAVGLLFVVIEPKKLGWRLLLALVIFAALSLFLQRPNYVIEQYQDWWRCLAADQRRVSTELGSWRDVWLLLRILHLPITVAGYALIQLAAAAGAAFLCWWRLRVSGWDRPRVIWLAFTLGCLWITLFGPSTELATYIFLAPSVALTCACILSSMIHREATLDFRGLLPLGAYLLLLLAEALNAWFPVIRQNNYLHAIQPVAGLIFAGFILGWQPPMLAAANTGVVEAAGK